MNDTTGVDSECLPFTSAPVEDLIARLAASPRGLTSDEAESRLHGGRARWRTRARGVNTWALLLAQFRSPIILILVGAAVLSLGLGGRSDALIILAIVAASGLLGFWQEWVAADALDRLLAMVRVRATVLRDGSPREVSLEDVVPGDVVLLDAGDVIPGDGRILESKDLFVAEAALTGETFPVEKAADAEVAPDLPLAARRNSLFLGTSVASGTARLLVVQTGAETEFGRISEGLQRHPPETDFERGVRRFGYLLLEVTLLLVLMIFALNVARARPVLDSLLFTLAIGVGLTPQLLPAIISVNLAHGARRMARSQVIVRRLAAIENFGSMDILCTDKTGTLTEGTVRVAAALDVAGRECERVRLHAYLNAALQVGYANPIDRAIVADRPRDLSAYRKLDELPYDFSRKRLSVLVAEGEARRIVTKGALANVLEVCTLAETQDGRLEEIAAVRPSIERQLGDLSAQGLRVLGVACRDAASATRLDRADEAGMTFLGILALDDPLRPGVADTLRRLEGLGISLMVITGDNQLAAAHVAGQAGLAVAGLLTGSDLQHMSDEALVRRVSEVVVFAEVEPHQKERIILSLRKAGHVVGYMGDGINDASALHAADVGISVAGAADVAREAAEIVLLEKDLGVLEGGVREGRATFANTMKYVFMATSANFGNMISLALASLVLHFLPLLPKQILLVNLLTDLPEMMIATDRVDPEMVERPQRWDIGFIRRFMIVFGALSSVFDVLTFWLLLGLLGASPAQFRTGWFLESVVASALVVLVVRTRRVFFRSPPGRLLAIATLLVVGFTLAVPLSPLAPLLGFSPMPAWYTPALGVIVLVYMIAAEVVKRFFYGRGS
jgi:Mg2+-importing ATPase